jgi:hypothetical protein
VLTEKIPDVQRAKDHLQLAGEKVRARESDLADLRYLHKGGQCAILSICGDCVLVRVQYKYTNIPTSLLIRFKMSAFVVATFCLPSILSSGRTNVLRVSSLLQQRQPWD